MTDVFAVLALNFAVLMSCMLMLWLISMALNDVSFIDSFWAFGFVIVAIVTYVSADFGAPARKNLLAAITLVWGLRLGLYLFWRWRKEGPDKRYVAMVRDKTGWARHLHTLRSVFLLQGVLLWIVSMPIQIGQLPSAPTTIGVLAYAGAALATIGILFESIGDWQLAMFKADPSNAGKVMDKGLWRYTRHPNYFGDACVWWGLFLIAVETTIGIFAIAGPLLITALLLKWSGAGLLERRLKLSKPQYTDYIARTSAFLPMPPKRAAATGASTEG